MYGHFPLLFWVNCGYQMLSKIFLMFQNKADQRSPPWKAKECGRFLLQNNLSVWKLNLRGSSIWWDLKDCTWHIPFSWQRLRWGKNWMILLNDIARIFFVEIGEGLVPESTDKVEKAPSGANTTEIGNFATETNQCIRSCSNQQCPSTRRDRHGSM